MLQVPKRLKERSHYQFKGNHPESMSILHRSANLSSRGVEQVTSSASFFKGELPKISFARQKVLG